MKKIYKLYNKNNLKFIVAGKILLIITIKNCSIALRVNKINLGAITE